MKDYKQKYLELKRKYISDIDAAHRMGYTKGYNQAQIDEVNMQKQQALASGGMSPNQPGITGSGNSAPTMGENQVDGQPVAYAQDGTPLTADKVQSPTASDDFTQNVDELYSMVSKSENKPGMKDIKKSVNKIKDSLEKFKNNSLSEQKDLTEKTKKVLDKEEILVKNIVNSFKKDAQLAAVDIEKLFNTDKKWSH